MVYRIAGVYRRRIDEIAPYFAGAEYREDPDGLVLVIPPTPEFGAGAEVRTMPAGFYVHWSSKRPQVDRDLTVEGMSAQELRDTIFARLGRWTEPLYVREMYADFNRKTGDLTVGRFRLVPFAADPALSVRLILDGIAEAAAYRERVEAVLRERVAALAAERVKKE